MRFTIIVRKIVSQFTHGRDAGRESGASVRLDVDGRRYRRKKSTLRGRKWKRLFLAGKVVVELEDRCLVLLLLLCAGRIQSFIWLHHWSKPDKISWQQTLVHSLEIVGQNYFITKNGREFSNWALNEIVKGFDEQRSAFLGETILQWSMLTLHVEDLWHNKATEVLRFITVPEYPQHFSSAQST